MVELTDTNENENEVTNETENGQTQRRGAGRPRQFSREEAQAIRRRKNEEGITFDELHEDTGVSVATLRKIVKGQGAYADTL